MSSLPSVYHALLRPSILQILRTMGYHSTRPSVVDTITDLAARYMLLLCENTAGHATHNHGDASDFDLVDVRLALQDAGALKPEKLFEDSLRRGDPDPRGIEEFLKWFSGPKMKEMMDIGSGDGESDATDYLNALMKKHSKTSDDSRYQGTILGRSNTEPHEIPIEGGAVTSIREWIALRSPDYNENDDGHSSSPSGTMQSRDNASPAPSSGLSSVGDRLSDVDVEEVRKDLDLAAASGNNYMKDGDKDKGGGDNGGDRMDLT